MLTWYVLTKLALILLILLMQCASLAHTCARSIFAWCSCSCTIPLITGLCWLMWCCPYTEYVYTLLATHRGFPSPWWRCCCWTYNRRVRLIGVSRFCFRLLSHSTCLFSWAIHCNWASFSSQLFSLSSYFENGWFLRNICVISIYRIQR